MTLKTNDDTNFTHHQQDGERKGGDDKTVCGGGGIDSSVPADGR